MWLTGQDLRTTMHGLPADVPIMVCEDVHAMVLKQVQLQHGVDDLFQKRFTAGAELVIWPGERHITGSFYFQ